MSPVTLRRPSPRRAALAPLRRVRRRTLLAGAIVVAALLAGGWLWLRDSSLVAIRNVRVVGLSGQDAAQIRSALVAAARRMTTLDLQRRALLRAVKPYPQVVGLRVSTQLPHGLRIVVQERIPLAVLVAGGRREVVDRDGVLLAGADTRGLPLVPLAALPSTNRVSAGHGLAEVVLLAAAPWQLLSHISQVANRPGEGLVVTLRGGPLVYFGSPARAADKWQALIAVLASGQAAGAGYIDVSDPEHPAAGTGSPGPITGVATTMARRNSSKPAATTAGTPAAATPAR